MFLSEVEREVRNSFSLSSLFVDGQNKSFPNEHSGCGQLNKCRACCLQDKYQNIR